MKIAPDTNLLVRLIMGDDEVQQRKAVETLESAELVAVGVHCLCELDWVLRRSYAIDRANVSAAIRRILGMRNVVASHPAIEAGLPFSTRAATSPTVSLLSRADGSAERRSYRSIARP